MVRIWMKGALGLIAAAAFGLTIPRSAQAEPDASLRWIWFDEGNPAASAPPEIRFFRRDFKLALPADEATLDIAADDGFKVWLNGKLVGKGKTHTKVYRFEVRPFLQVGRNVLAVQGENHGGAAGVLVHLTYATNGQSRDVVVSDASWRSSRTAPAGWQKLDFDDASWKAAKVLGAYGMAPWGKLAWEGSGNERFTVPPGFRVELAVKPPATDPRFSLVNMTFDDKGRLLVSRESGPVLLCTRPDANGVLQEVQPYCTQVRNCQGMCWVRDALLLVGDGPKGTGLYRCRDTKGKDKSDEVTLLLRFRGGMGEHGPHAILHGPDDCLYVVIGNHGGAIVDKLALNSPLRRWPTGAMGPDQGKPNTTEDVLLPRLNDANGHAANILAPGGTIWRMDHDGKNLSLVAAGFRNHFDAAFSPQGELFTFDSDMEWDENLPWYRAVRICHCPPGADFVWRTGAANTPDYYLDSLPPLYETGRGSPVGLEFYDHYVYPEKYRGAYFLADWSLGKIHVAFLERDGASYKANVETFCSGAPLNVTDLNVGPDGALYFVMGGRGSQGGVYRIVYAGKPGEPSRDPMWFFSQPLAAWSRAKQNEAMKNLNEQDDSALQHLQDTASSSQQPPLNRIRALDLLSRFDRARLAKLLPKLVEDDNPELRAHGILWLGILGRNGDQEKLLRALKDGDALVRRRACEALIRRGLEPPVDALGPLLADRDRFVRLAARLVLERIDPRKWAERLSSEPSELVVWNSIIALCHTNQAAAYAEPIFMRLRGQPPIQEGAAALLDYLRTVQMALIHVPQRPIWVKGIAEQCEKLFPHSDWRINRELAILLTDFRREGQLDARVNGKLLDAMLSPRADRQQQIHYFYCLRLIKDGWTPAQHLALAAWYNGTQTWQGGHSFTPFLANIFKDCLNSYSVEAQRNVLARAEKMPLPALVIAGRLQLERPQELVPNLDALSRRLAKAQGLFRESELRQAVEDALTRTVLTHPTPAAWPLLVQGLASVNPLVRSEALAALRKMPQVKPKADDPAPYRTLLTITPRLTSLHDKWTAIEVLRQWNGRSFGAEEGDWKMELNLWARWFGQTFPKETPLASETGQAESESKYKFAELLDYLSRDPHGSKGDVKRGRTIFEKASCIKCHKFGKDGEGVGPDLTTVAKRFKRGDILESILYPSKAISDQYRSVTITTVKGQQLTGLAAAQGDTVTVLLSDTTRVTLKQGEIESQVASLVSVMPERLLDTLTREEIADLFAFLESEPRQ
jgi:putative heme-binding domain-containing protein